MRTKKEKKKLKPVVIVILVIISVAILSLSIIFYNKTAKKSEIGNNSTSQEIVDYILNINSYETKIEVEVQSNKNKNKYIIKQNYNQEEEIQEILEPTNIAGVKIIKNGNNLKLENSNLNLVTMFENYECIADNRLDLSSFIKEFKEDETATWEEKDGIIMMQTKSKNNFKILYINRDNGKPEKMEIKDANKNTVVYILYREVIVNS